ncbi:hypothetical protein B0T26DRAFT_724164 [Lasiosphaeria miniovina]|uniref:Uncharacterized protein n=1 Tax=Lasiosphaeria miniovina TaxID=1954250 RepID=A0AA40DSA2_9PEZI|nr:uncharacterized protein B0T26DRAFT_724164 [Lasiosphaeria miniovina]KAK0710133.1 hypothetical protein B0T26DRAFT_724164 [Lasiosphaeria miniovina]
MPRRLIMCPNLSTVGGNAQARHSARAGYGPDCDDSAHVRKGRLPLALLRAVLSAESIHTGTAPTAT